MAFQVISVAQSWDFTRKHADFNHMFDVLISKIGCQKIAKRWPVFSQHLGEFKPVIFQQTRYTHWLFNIAMENGP
jgi:hypothetical protein